MSAMRSVRRRERALILGIVLGVAVTALAASGVIGMAVYTAWVDERREQNTSCVE